MPHYISCVPLRLRAAVFASLPEEALSRRFQRRFLAHTGLPCGLRCKQPCRHASLQCRPESLYSNLLQNTGWQLHIQRFYRVPAGCCRILKKYRNFYCFSALCLRIFKIAPLPVAHIQPPDPKLRTEMPQGPAYLKQFTHYFEPDSRK